MFAHTGAAIGEDRDPMTESELGRAAAHAPLLVNGVARSLALPCTVTALLAQLEMAGKRVAVSVNRSVIPRSRHPEALVHAGDRVEILEAVGGG
jgi:sulfur carrier protein